MSRIQIIAAAKRVHIWRGFRAYVTYRSACCELADEMPSATLAENDSVPCATPVCANRLE